MNAERLLFRGEIAVLAAEREGLARDVGSGRGDVQVR